MSSTEPEVLFQEHVLTSNENRLALIDSVLAFLKEKNIKLSIDSYELYLLLDEAITNSMEHGNRWNNEKQIRLRVCERQDQRIEIQVRDEGIGFNPSILPGSLNANGRLNPRGRGIFILKKFSTVRWNELGNEIYLELRREE